MDRDEKAIKGVWEWGPKECMDGGKRKDRQSSMMKRVPLFSLLTDPACPPASPSSPAAHHCKARPAAWPDSCHAPSHRGSRHREPVEDRIARIIWWTEAEVDFFGEKWMEEAFELRLSVIYDFQQIRCSLELLSHLGRAKGGNCCCRFSSMPADESMLELSAQREGGQWTYFKDRYLFQQIDPETI